MKIAFVADVHLGNHKTHGGPVVASLNQRCIRAVEVFGKAVDRAAALGCAGLYVLGDLFDYQRPEAQLIYAVQRILARAGEANMHMKMCLLIGNHDMTSTTPGDHALGPLSPYASVISKPAVIHVTPDIEVGLVPFMPGKGLDVVTAALDVLWPSPILPKGKTRLLGIHLGVSDDRTPPWLQESPDSITVGDLVTEAGAKGVSAVFAGNWHDRRFWKGTTVGGFTTPSVFQLGALVPTGWDNPGLNGYGTLGIWEDGDVSYEELAGPRFIASTLDKVAVDVDVAQKLTPHVFVRVTTPPDLLAEGRAALEALGVAGDVRADATEATVAARMAATVARSADTLEEALAGFVGSMTVPEGVDRKEVALLAQEYLRGGA